MIKKLQYIFIIAINIIIVAKQLIIKLNNEDLQHWFDLWRTIMFEYQAFACACFYILIDRDDTRELSLFIGYVICNLGISSSTVHISM